MRYKNNLFSILAGVLLISFVSISMAQASGEALSLTVTPASPGGVTSATVTIINPTDIESFSLTFYFASGSILSLPAVNWFTRGNYYPSVPFGTVELNNAQLSTQKIVFLSGFSPSGASGAVGAFTFNVSPQALATDTHVLSITGNFFSKADKTVKEFLPGSTTFSFDLSTSTSTTVTPTTTPASTTTVPMTTTTTAISGSTTTALTTTTTTGSTTPEGLIYTKTNGLITIIGYTCPATESLVIPGTIEGKPVVVIGDDAFKNCATLNSVTIPTSILTIGDNAFNGCSGLTTATFAGNAPGMGGHVFDNCAGSFIIKYYAGATGFSTPWWYGYPTIIINSTTTTSALPNTTTIVPLTTTTITADATTTITAAATTTSTTPVLVITSTTTAPVSLTTTTINNKCPALTALGDDSQYIENLRDFRDSRLAQTALGRKVIEIYYNNTDSINDALERSPALREAARKVLEVIAPMVGDKEE